MNFTKLYFFAFAILFQITCNQDLNKQLNEFSKMSRENSIISKLFYRSSLIGRLKGLPNYQTFYFENIYKPQQNFMIYHFQTCAQLIILFYHAVANWKLIDKSITGQTIYQNNWKILSECQETNETSLSSFTYSGPVILNKSIKHLSKKFLYKCFQVQIIFDVYFEDADSFLQSQFKVTQETFDNFYTAQVSEQQLYQLDATQSDLIQSSALICQNGVNKFQFQTVVSTIAYQKTDEFFIKLCFHPGNDNIQLTIKNLLIYVNACHPTCLTCDGPAETSCLSCFNNQSVSEGKCTCIPEKQFSQTLIGCRQECDRDNSIARSDKTCVEDYRIQQNATLFDGPINPNSNPRYQPLIFEKDEFNYKNCDLVDEDFYHKDFIGKLQYNEGMLYQMNLENAVKFIRIRITFYLFNFNETSSIFILQNNQIQALITKGPISFQVQNQLKIFEQNYIQNSSYTLLRVEMILQLFNSNPNILIKGQLSSQNESWGFRQFTVDKGFCQVNCKICADFSSCQSCQPYYKLYRNSCVYTCPIHSSNCIDYEDILPYSRYLAKGFYDLNMTLQEIKAFYDITTDPQFSHSSEQKFSFFNNKIVLGGFLVWNDGSYIKTWMISKPHYAATIYFNLTYGDGYTGDFFYIIGNDSTSLKQGPFRNPGGGQNLVGCTELESIQYFNISLTNFYSNRLYVEFVCDVATADIKKEFCAISEYFIVIHYVYYQYYVECPPFCSNCASFDACLEAVTTNCGLNQYLVFDSQTETYMCKDCNQPGCSTCTRAEECTQCVSNQFNLSNGICLCNPFTFFQGNACFQCNKYCEYCFGDSQYNCLTCVRDYHRGIQRKQCLCLPGYYDDGINLPCLPLCGDEIVVEEEDCDDGNNNPFDGCNNCKFACNFACDICINGKCYQCKNGYEVHNNDCHSKCLGNTIGLLQQCFEEKRNCVNCQFQCSIQCTVCDFGICQQCNETNGWYLSTDGTCHSICGDNILVLEEEQCDDDQNILCNQCQITCDINCLECIKGVCIICAQGYKWNQQLKKCVQVCGDGVLIKKENICEDRNNLLDDGCYLCQLSCLKSCTLCTENGCLQCDTIGWKLEEIQNKCEPVCGDGIIVQNEEECDDLIDQNCFQCRYNCQESCLICQNGNCLQCKEGWIVNLDKKCYSFFGDSKVVGEEQCDDYNSIMYDGCYLSKYQCQQSCLKCEFGVCIDCEHGYYNLEGKCLEILNDGHTKGNEQCDDMNLIAQDGCFNGMYDCPRHCKHCYQGQCLRCNLQSHQLNTLNNQCISQCGDGYLQDYEECDDGNIIPQDGCHLCVFQCNQNCQICQFGVCFECSTGYYLDKSKNSCYSICGDGIQIHEEQCENGDLGSNKLCLSCNLGCNEQCTTCVDGLCFECTLVGWNLDLLNMNCQPTCGDQLVLGNEQCDDGNDNDDDGCIDCYIQFQDQCTLCQKGFCKECNVKGWQLFDATCRSICGDKLVVGLEECDDGNQLPYDGCYECKFQCSEQCTECLNGVCKSCFSPGWVLDQQKRCTTLCGDGIVVDPFEQCDDGNDNPNDGCYLCEYQCSKGCIECQQQQCNKCDNSYILDLKTGNCVKENSNDYNDLDIEMQQIIQQTNFRCGENHILIDHACVTQCGNGIFMNQYEECDDGNNQGGDGCSTNCHIEDSYQCINQQGSLSLCAYIVAPKFNLNILSNDVQQTQTVELTFTQEVKLEEGLNFQEVIVFTIIPQTRYQLTVNSISNLTNTLNNPKYQIWIEFSEPVQNPNLQVDLQKNAIFNRDQIGLLENQQSVNFGTPIVLLESTKQQLISIVQLNNAMMYSMVGISSLAFLTGNAIMCFNLLDLLQSLSYVKYIQYQFPPHFNDFLNTYTKVSLQPILEIFQIDQLFAISASNQVNKNLQRDPKYILQQPYLYNVKSCYFSVLLSILTYLIYSLITSENFQHKIFQLYLKYQDNNKIVKLIRIFQQKVVKKCIKLKLDYFSLGIFKVYLAMLHQFMFSVMLQFPNYKFGSPFEFLNSINAIFGLVLILISTLNLLSITTATIKNIRKWKHFFSETKTHYWALQFKTFQIYRIQFYILIIVKLIHYPEVQSILLSVQSLLYLIYLVRFKPLISMFELSKLIIREFLLMIISGTFLIYSFEMSQDNFILLGWIHIGMFCSILASNLFIDLFTQIKKAYDNYVQQKLKYRNEEEKKQYLKGFEINQIEFMQRQ